MRAGFAILEPHAVRSPAEPSRARLALEPCTPGELRALVHGGETDSDAVERLLVKVARSAGALDLAIGEGLAALTVGDRLISLGCSRLRDYAREVLGLQERTAQGMARLSRELRARPLLREAVLAGEVRPRNAQAVLPVAIGDAEALWVERARHETVRALEAAVRSERDGGLDEDDDEWTRFRVRLAPESRATVDEALAIAGRILPGSPRAQRLEAMAQEYIAAHPVEAGDDGAGPAGRAFQPDSGRLEALKARLEAETDRWSFLESQPGVPAPDPGFDDLVSANEIDARLRQLASQRDARDDLLGYCAYAVRRSGIWKLSGFADFEHYCDERLGLAARTVEQRAALERRLWEVPGAPGRARRGSLVREGPAPVAPPGPGDRGLGAEGASLTCVELARALQEGDEAQMRAARILRARLPARTALLLKSAFRAVRAVEGRLLDDGRCLVEVAREFIETWKPHVKRARTPSQRVRERDLGCCQVPGCSRRAVHAHHVVPRSRGGSDDPSNLVALCACHHLRGIHGGYLHVSGSAPDELVWELRGGLPPAWWSRAVGPAHDLVAGSQTRNVLPVPGVLSTVILPPCASTSPRVMKSPSPSPRFPSRAFLVW